MSLCKIAMDAKSGLCRKIFASAFVLTLHLFECTGAYKSV